MFRSFNICQREMTDRSKNSSMQAQRFDGTKIAVFDQSMSIHLTRAMRHSSTSLLESEQTCTGAKSNTCHCEGETDEGRIRGNIVEENSIENFRQIDLISHLGQLTYHDQAIRCSSPSILPRAVP